MKSGFNLVFENRDFTTRQEPAGLKFQVNSYSFKAIGGCAEASISATGGELALWDLINWLRCPVKIYDGAGTLLWWGYVHQAQVRQDALEIAAGLDSMVNRVAVAYSYVETGSQTVGARKTTSWADNLDSQSEFGIKEFLSSASGLSDAAAEGRRAAILAAQAWPQGGLTAQTTAGVPRARVRYSGAKKSLSATLICRGWWDTLGWQYYANTGVTSVSTTTQIAAIVTGEGQFLNATDVGAASGISASEYRDGDSTALQEILGLMAAGGANGRRLLSSVDPNRRVQIFEEPAASSLGYYLTSQAQLLGTGGIAVSELAPPVGVWCRLTDVLPGVVDLTKLVDPSLQFIEGSGWSASSGAAYSFRGQPSIESVLEIGG